MPRTSIEKSKSGIYYFRLGGLTDSQAVLDILEKDLRKAQEECKRLVNEPCEERCLEIENGK